jgi:hypothetical protein
VGLTLTALDTAYEEPDAATIARVVGELDGGRLSLVTLGRSDAAYVQVRGTVRDGFALSHQHGSLERRQRSRDEALPLALVVETLQRYAENDPEWSRGVVWEAEVTPPSRTGWSGTWAGFALLVLIAAVLVWLLRGW